MSNRYRDASLSPEERTEDLLAQMTLDEKLAQLQCHFFAHGDLQKDTRYGIGQISTLNSGRRCPWRKQRASNGKSRKR